MLSKPLLKREIKSNYKILLFMFAVMTMYGAIIIAMFDPELGESLKMMAEGMPQLFAAFGMNSFSSVLVEFLAQLLYNLIFVVFPLILIIILTLRLLIHYNDRGSMAYLLATPNSRGKIVRTQLFVMVLANISLCVFATVMCIIISQIMFPGELEIGKFVVLNFGLLCLIMFFSGLCFCTACIFQEAKLANGIGIGISIAFLMIKMIAQTGDKAEFFKYLTPMTLFDTKALVTNQSKGYIGAIVLLVVGLIFYGVGVKVFCRKDLSL
ncbi:MAG: ABC transporter permease subunit [Clostridiales bacterium]|nr:ABC transporter permease subunit [Clostridiales bacterium]